MLGCLSCAFSCLSWLFGIYTFAYLTIISVASLYRNFIRKPLNLEQRYGKGTWAVVTGATGGIGEAFWRQLAQQNFNIVLVGRNKQLLEESEQRVLEANKSIKTKLVQVDLSESLDPEFYENIQKELIDIDVSILVNNAGAGVPKHFEITPAQEHLDNICINAGAPALLTHVLINKMLARKDRSAIINVSSVGNNSPLPYFGVYPATKRFLTFFSFQLHELFKHKIDVQNLVPGYVKTKLASFAKDPTFISPDRCVKSSLRDLGQDLTCSPHIFHSIMGLVMHSTYRFCKPLWRATLVDKTEMIALKEFRKKVLDEMKNKKND